MLKQLLPDKFYFPISTQGGGKEDNSEETEDNSKETEDDGEEMEDNGEETEDDSKEMEDDGKETEDYEEGWVGQGQSGRTRGR